MSPGPLRRLVGAAGLAALIPTALLLATGSLTVLDAATRAAVTLVITLLVGRVADRSLSLLIVTYERGQQPEDPEADESSLAASTSGAPPRRRADDR